MTQDNPYSKSLLKIGGASLFDATSIRQVVALIESQKPAFVVVSAMKGHTEILQKIADMFFEYENTFDARELLFKYQQDVLSVAKKLDIGFTIGRVISNMRKEIDEQTDVDTLSSDEGKRPDFTNFMLSFGERISVHLLMAYMKKKTEVSCIYANSRSLIQVGANKSSKKEDGGFAPNVQESVCNLSRFLKSKPTAENQIIFMEGFLAKGNKNLGRNGSDTTLALVALAYQKNGYEPLVSFLKAEPFKTAYSFEDTIMPYQTFLDGQIEGEQFYVHEDAVAMLSDADIPFQILSSNDENYRLVVAKEDLPLAAVFVKKIVSNGCVIY